jgi:hypothetical protein
MVYVLKRRSLIRAAGSAMLALPALELFRSDRASAMGSGPPKRYIFMYGGVSIGRDNGGETVTPDNVGVGYDLKRSLWPLGTDPLPYGGSGFDVQDEVSVVSGLQIPWNTGNGVPPGGKSPEFHYNTVGPSVSGVRGGASRTNPARGPSSDQVIADAIAGDTNPRILNYRVQPASYVGSNGGGGDSGRISWRADGSGNIVGEDPIISPRLAYESLFSNFVPPDPAEAEAAAFLLQRRQSVVENVRARTEHIIPRLGAADRQRMERHLDELRGFEERLKAVPPPTGGACELPPDPGQDPPIGEPHASNDGGHNYTQTAAWSDEELRAELLCDMIRMSFACDLSRVAALRMTRDQCFLNMFPLTEAHAEMHESSHGQGTINDHSDAVGWHVKHFARLVSLLRDTQELDGSSLLDHTAVVMLFEGGFGFDPESGSNNRAHSTENMVALVAGRVGGLLGGQHIATAGKHPATVLVSAMQALGLQTDTHGEITGNVPELFA